MNVTNLIAFLWILTSCNNQLFNDSASSRDVAVEPKVTQDVEVEQTDSLIASEPQMVGGAFLVCHNPPVTDLTAAGVSQSTEKVIGCRALDDQGQPLSGDVSLGQIQFKLTDGSLLEPKPIEQNHDVWLAMFLIEPEIQETILSANGIVAIDGEDFRIDSSEETQAPRLKCPADFVLVPANLAVGIDKAFCISSYEMRQVGGRANSQAVGLPWVSIALDIAKAACIAEGWQLPSNAHWMALARAIEAEPSNWSLGKVGEGALNRGHSDSEPAGLIEASDNFQDACVFTNQACDLSVWSDQRRVHRLNNGLLIWDVAGNAHELVDWVVIEDKASPANAWLEIGDTTPTTSMLASSYFPSRPDWGKAQGMGAYFPGQNGQGGTTQRGGSWGDDDNTGIYALALDLGAQRPHGVTGFRCVSNP
ncbi:hypothetical protein [Pseudobacteriovorax antillogorgiicola]|uniref:Sulfatase-modifying factor enzyme domain-containing protein n=1 Tax=Pseudobacteriovorax antillogorgiicola TaxID=1513793 RepID=A0A1Y6C341_9BACT|nr:hypothetical protein [Pseudobacteriovorax antillogorgiicola]TCS52261.1 hypothetical protein EDD56_1095 [Pseudobacteriovorax antillogorgiicola]SMF30991.1 hypothetical protein SAMN06296036_109208 [Pseudobacteriovorax antillogorgiicola]